MPHRSSVPLSVRDLSPHRHADALRIGVLMHRDSPDKADPAESTVNLQIVACEPCHCADFVRLSRLWLDEYFCVEAEDEQIFADPIASFAPGGGGIFVARDEASGRVAGVCALAYHARTGDWELAKLCVDPAFRGHGAGGSPRAARDC